MAFGQWLALPSLPNNNSLSLQGLLAINPLARLFEFVVGIGACSVFLWLRPRIPKLHTAVFTIVEGLVLLVVAYFIMGNPTYMFVWNVLGPGVWFDWLNHTGTFWVFAALIIVLAIGRGLISKLLSTRLLLALGEMSFSVYLIHLTIFAAYNYRGETPDYLGLSICLAITLTLAYVIWRFVEAPVRKAVKARIKAGLELTSRHEVDLVLQNRTLAMQTR
jgi:peptidoglycan/LPS O-acetylase OafA/YrhL